MRASEERERERERERKTAASKRLGTQKNGQLTSPSVSTISPRVTALAPSPAAATSELPEDGEADAKRIEETDVVVNVVDAVSAAFVAFALLIGGSSVTQAADDPVVVAADVEAAAPARMREAAWRSIGRSKKAGNSNQKGKEELRRKGRKRKNEKPSASDLGLFFFLDLLRHSAAPRPLARGIERVRETQRDKQAF